MPGGAYDSAGEPETPERPLGPLLEYSPRVWIGGRMCVTHICGLAGAAEVGPPKNLVPGACSTATRPMCGWLRLAHWTGTHPRGPKGAARGCGGVHIGHLRCAQPGRHPPHPVAWGATNCRARTTATQEVPGGSNPPELGWVWRRYSDRPRRIYFWSATGLKIAPGPR